ncbi:hypothetical protein GCM10010507_56390 [Streptomyces cinnamoneus]|uniref:Uncharacterized protein n=1 Tax=Streptomyces cinnamoneus TaxID=53446 RepID=A0A918U0A3_STRCJ|nr:hypothetical protein GCM10010507_56390 [Streptomyces cinnamoneus]
MDADADRDEGEIGVLGEVIADDGEVGVVPVPDVDHSGSRRFRARGRVRARLRFSHWEGCCFLDDQALDRDASPGRGPSSVWGCRRDRTAPFSASAMSVT